MNKPTIARKLVFYSLDDILADAKRIAAQPDANARGNWTPAQNVWHVARVIQASVEGFPAGVPWLLKLIGPLLKNRVTSKPFNPGIKMPTSLTKHFIAPANTQLSDAVSLLEKWIGQAKAKGFIPASPLFGKLSGQQWTDLHCRHAELHFGMIALND